VTRPKQGAGRPRREGVLRRRILGAFLTLSLLPLFGSNGVGYLRSRAIVEELVGRYLDGMAQIQASHVQDRLDQRLLYLEAVASGNRFLQAAAERSDPTANPAMSAAADPPAVEEYLRRKLREVGRFETLSLYRLDGTVLASSHDDIRSDGWRPGASGQVTLLPDPDPEHPPTLRFTVPIRNDAGVEEAYLSATVPLGRGSEFLEIPPHVAGTIESFILDSRGRPVFVSHPHGHLDYHGPLESPLVGASPGGHAQYRDREQVEVFGASASLDHYGWLFIAEVPASDALRDLGTLRTLSLVLGGVFALLVLSVGWWMAGSMVAPLQRLVSATRGLGGGDLTVRVSDPGADEIGELMEAFNEMAAAMAADRERIAGLHRREIERAQQLATVGELASGVAHEIKNPVVGISNGLDLVLRRVDDPDLTPITDEMKRQLSRIEGAVRDLLAFAKPASPRLAPTDINHVVERALSLVGPAAGKRHVNLDTELDEALPLLTVDAEMIRQALVNLLLNAVHASPDGGSVRVTSTAARDRVLVAIEDRGPGLGADEVERIFKPFYTTRHSGTGLGLSITRGIVEQHGGKVNVTSLPGKGATFTVELPAGTGDPGDEEGP